MGRTSPTFRDLLRAMERRWGDYRRALRWPDQARFDRLFAYAREHADAASYLNHETPQFPILVGIALEQERRLDELAERLDAVEGAADGRRPTADGDADAVDGTETGRGTGDATDSATPGE